MDFTDFKEQLTGVQSMNKDIYYSIFKAMLNIHSICRYKGIFKFGCCDIYSKLSFIGTLK